MNYLFVFRLYFSRKWWWTTLLMFVAVGVMIRLGFWQLDRLHDRQTKNEHIRSVQAMGPLDLSTTENLPDLVSMEYRSAYASGSFDFNNQVALRNQYWGDPDGSAEYGYHLITPLVFTDGRAVLVDRGWIPSDYSNRDSWTVFNHSTEDVIRGIIRAPMLTGEMGGLLKQPRTPGQPITFWNYLDMELIQEQVPYELFPIYLQQDLTDEQVELPYRSLPVIELSDGAHLGFALQWFFYASLVFFGYPVYLRKQASHVVMKR